MPPPLAERMEIIPAGRPIRGRVRPPGSKSITNRALVCAALASGTSTLTGALESEDTRVMIDSLGRLGIAVHSRDEGRTLVVHGCGGRIPAEKADLFVGNSGTTIRFLTALCCLGRGVFRLDGVQRMRQRPIGDLLDALNQLGADCRGELRDGFPPVIVRGQGLRGGQARIRGEISSQFLSGLLLAAPYAASTVEVAVEGRLVSKPYVAMTLQIMDAFGVHSRLGQTPAAGAGSPPPTQAAYRPLAPEPDATSTHRGSTVLPTDHSTIAVPAPQTYAPRTYAIEPDASAASYFWAAAAITGGEVTVEGLTNDSLQGDVQFVDCLAQMGCEVRCEPDGITVVGRPMRGIDVDMNAISDTVQTLAAVALFADGPTAIRGVAHIRHKETDRIGDLARELRKFGAAVTELADGLRIEPPRGGPARAAASHPPLQTRSVSQGPIDIETYHDHRMAMSLALPGLVLPGVVILNPACTAKTYPRFFDDLHRLCQSQEKQAQSP